VTLLFRAWQHALTLKKPYRLSFAILERFDVFYVALEGEGSVGFGEITPLPEYGGETVGEAKRALGDIARALSAGGAVDDVARRFARSHPFTASGLICALETWGEANGEAFGPVSREVPLAGLCAGETPGEIQAEARRLRGAGHAVFKMKAGRRPDVEEALVRAAAKELPPGGSIRLDANQAYSEADALEVCKRLEDLSAVALLEQPFEPEMWSETERLAAATSFPIMLDESIWSAHDVARAAASGARHVKLKLCKHPGIAASAALIGEATRRGLGVVYGNGVQSALGNHLEARVHAASGLASAIEANGFAKVRQHPFSSGLEASEGTLVDGGVAVTTQSLASGLLVAEARIPRAAPPHG
jgi:o-succinylbenzoate synthase